MTKGKSKICGRCGGDITCRMDDIQHCECTKVSLSQDCFDFLQKTDYNCLCNLCLLEVNSLVETAHKVSDKPVENVHYYMENGFLVFTELNHIKRGYCCKSNCRHCAYGYTPKET